MSDIHRYRIPRRPVLLNTEMPLSPPSLQGRFKIGLLRSGAPVGAYARIGRRVLGVYIRPACIVG
jgi:hypothetical protein